MASDIGVVIPAYNREATLGRAIESVLAQTSPAHRVVVVDDGSTDRTGEVAAGYDGVVTLSTAGNTGAAAARNRGVDALSTTWIAFLDSDDHWSPDHLERLGTAIEGTSGRADLYFDDTRRTRFEGSALLWDLAGFSIEGSWQLIEDGTPWVLLPRQPLMLQSTIVRRSRFLEVGGLDVRLRSRHDTHLFLVLGIGSPLCAVAGLGATMTDDDRSGERQMDAMGWQTKRFADHTVVLYGDVLDRFPSLGDAPRAQLRRRLCEGHLRRLRFAVHDRDPIRFTTSLAGAVRADPSRVVGAVARAVRGPGRQAP